MDSDIRELLREKAEEVRSDPILPAPVRRRARRRRALHATLAGGIAAGIAVAAFVGAQSLLNRSPEPRTPLGHNTQTSEVWFTYDNHLFFTTRETPDTPEGALDALLSGPSEQQAGAGVQSAIPSGTTLLNSSVNDSIASVDFSSDFVSGEPNVDTMRLRVAQVVYTVSQFTPFADQALIYVDGDPIAQHLTFDWTPTVNGAQIRADYEDLLPPILVEQPQIGDTVTSPVTISGTANVFEATVSFRILDANGDVLTEDFVTAECGSGCRGDYTKDLPFTVDREQAGTVMVYEASAENSQPINVVRIPVTLEPSAGGGEQLQGELWHPTRSEDALDPTRTAIAFATEVLQWNEDEVSAAYDQPNDPSVIDLFDLSTTTGNRDPGPHVSVWLQESSTEEGTPTWAIWQVQSTLIDVECPSPRQDVIVTTSPVEICGSFTEQSAGWIVQATMEYADSELQPSEAASTTDVPVQGQNFDGNLDLISTFVGEDVSVQIKVYSGSGHLLGMFARRYVTEQANGGGQASPSRAVLDTRQAILDAAIAHDYDALAALIDESTFTYSFGESGDPIGYWRKLENQGHVPVLGDYLRGVLLGSPPAKQGNIWVWPGAFAKDPSQWTEENLADMRGLYSEQDIQSFREAGGYLGYRVGIRSDGTWMFFVEGD